MHIRGSICYAMPVSVLYVNSVIQKEGVFRTGFVWESTAVYEKGLGSSFLASIQVPVFAALVVLSVVLPFAPNASAATTNVSIVDLAFQPNTINVQLCDTVIWTNNGDFVHTVTSDGGAGPLNSLDLSKGDAYSFTFLSEGTYKYHCTKHPSMTGTVTVGGVVPEFSSTAFVAIGLMIVLLGLLVLGRRE